MAVTGAKALLQLVASKLRTNEALADDEVFTLYVAVTVGNSEVLSLEEAVHGG